MKKKRKINLDNKVNYATRKISKQIIGKPKHDRACILYRQPEKFNMDNRFSLVSLCRRKMIAEKYFVFLSPSMLPDSIFNSMYI